MCNHKPEFFKYYFENRNVLLPAKIEKKSYICKRCGEKVSIDKKYIPYEIAIRIFHKFFIWVILFSFTFWEYYNDNMKLRPLIWMTTFVVYYLLDSIIEYLFYLLLIFRKTEEF